MPAPDSAGPVVDVEATVTRLDLPESAELETAQWLVKQVMEQRKVWIAAWHEVILRPELAVIREFPAETVGCSAGSCELVVSERVVARFVTRFRESPIGVDVEAEMPVRKWEEASSEVIGNQSGKVISGRARVVYEEIAGRVDWACEDPEMEGTARSVDEMKRGLVARFGMRFDFVRA